MITHGRTTIYANIREKDLLEADFPSKIKLITKVLQDSIDIHNQNSSESEYLIKYLYGEQDIKDKIKLTRTDINNKGVENWAWAFQDQKKSMLVGKPITYAPFDNTANKEITELNRYILSKDKESLDQDMYEDIFTVGRGYRYCWTNLEKEQESPFDLLNLDVTKTEVVYSSSIKHEQILAYVVTPKMYLKKTQNEQTNELIEEQVNYNEYTVYCRDYFYTFEDKNGKIQYIKDSAIPNVYKKHVVYEYFLNRYRVSLLEIGKDIFNDINYIESLDKDDIESFVNSIMVFTNAKVDKEKMDAIKEYGAISIKSTNDKKASVELLQSRLKSADTQTYYLRKLLSLHAILGVPQSQGNAESRAETGQATMVEQGFTSANLRTENEEKAFKKGDRQVLDMMLTICRESPKSLIKKLTSNEIDIKFSRDLSDSIMTKTQALQNLYNVKIPPAVANAVINLFSDPVAVTKMQEEYIKELDEKEKEKEEMQYNKKLELSNKDKDISVEEELINE